MAWRLAALLVVLIGAASTPAWSQDASRTRNLPGAVVRIVSGDTLSVFVNGQVERVRFIGVTAPEPGEGDEGGDPQGREAVLFVRGLLNAKNVRLELDAQERDAEGRLLAYVWLGDVMANAEVIARGYGQVVTGGPNVRYQDLLLRLQQEARAARLGIWRSAAPPPPTGKSGPSGAAPAASRPTGGAR